MTNDYAIAIRYHHHRGASAWYCEKCVKGNPRARREPDRKAAMHTAKLALERIANKGKSKSASKNRNNGIKPLNAGIQARIDAIVERAKQNGTCYGAG